jgi:rare lipoprotein A (peptidoglycan hydrolase)
VVLSTCGTGNPKLQDDLFFTQCWDESKSVMVRVSDSCPCQYPIKGPDGTTQEIRTQNWCCGGNNHFDLSFWAFEQLAHPTYGVMPIEYRPVNCETREPLRWVRRGVGRQALPAKDCWIMQTMFALEDIVSVPNRQQQAASCSEQGCVLDWSTCTRPRAAQLCSNAAVRRVYTNMLAV